MARGIWPCDGAHVRGGDHLKTPDHATPSREPNCQRRERAGHGRAMKLVLFDIDGTLMTTGAAGADAMRDVFAELCGILMGLPALRCLARPIRRSYAKRSRIISSTRPQCQSMCFTSAISPVSA